MASPSPSTSSPPPETHGWQRFATSAWAVFHDYANWLVSITWMRFFLLSVLVLIVSAILQKLPPFSHAVGGGDDISSSVIVTPRIPPRAPRAPNEPAIKIEKKDLNGHDVTISIDRDGVRITPRARAAASAASAAPAASAASAALASPGTATIVAAIPATPGTPTTPITPTTPTTPTTPSTPTPGDGSVEIKLPPGADSDAVREAVEEARQAVVEAIREAQEKDSEATQEAAEDAAVAKGTVVRTVKRNHGHVGDFLTDLAFLIIVASAILKITYKGTIQAETKAAVATETAESEQLKRQVVEARMAAMQAQVEPHFLFNTLASIDHLIETDPPRASQMQKNLIALLRASMPSMRESNPLAHNLGREMAVIRPYLEILKVRMEDRLQAIVNVPDGLLSAEFPPMMIQSLVENAIKHGLEPKAEGGQLAVSAEIVHGQLAVTVADTGLGFGRAATAGTGIGLANIRERLKLLYGDRATMVVADNSPQGTVVTLTVPYQALPQAAAQEGNKA